MTTSSIPPGTVLAGKFLVERVLGVGGIGVVVAARHLQLDQTVAIKYLLPAALTNPEMVERFAREARAASKIRGEHVAHIIDVGQFDDGSPFMVMECLEGHDIGTQLELHGPMPIEEATRYILETCEALAEAHAAKIVHRDLKPSNLFLANQPGSRSIVKVLDFGISKIGDGAPSEALTKTFSLMGTVFYMSPEQLSTPKAVDARSDIWALGVILYELLTGIKPFDGETVPGIMASIIANRPEPITSHRPDLPEGLVRAIARCMQMEVADRFANVAQLAQALEPYAAPEDRRSVQIIARVLGETMDPPAPGSASTLMMPSRPLPVARASSAIPIVTPAASARSPVVAISTSAGVAASTHEPAVVAGKRSPLVLGGIAAVIAVALGTAAFIAQKPSAIPPAAAGFVSTPMVAPLESTPMVATVAPEASPPSMVPVVTYTPVELDPTPIEEAPVKTKAASSANTAASAKPVANARAASTASAQPTPARSAKPVATVASPPTATAVPPKNPLNMEIK